MKKEKNNDKKITDHFWMFIPIVLVVMLGIIYFTDDSTLEPTSLPYNSSSTLNNCYNTNVIEKRIEPFDVKYSTEVTDYFIDKKEFSIFYLHNICKDLLEVELYEKLSKSDNLNLLIDVGFIDRGTLLCGYKILWEYETIENTFITYNSEVVEFAQKNRPPIYNESLVSVEWREEFQETILENHNNDYVVTLKLYLKKSMEVCN